MVWYMYMYVYIYIYTHTYLKLVADMTLRSTRSLESPWAPAVRALSASDFGRAKVLGFSDFGRAKVLGFRDFGRAKVLGFSDFGRAKLFGPFFWATLVFFNGFVAFYASLNLLCTVLRFFCMSPFWLLQRFPCLSLYLAYSAFCSFSAPPFPPTRHILENHQKL